MGLYEVVLDVSKDLKVFASYHPSRLNVNTGRLNSQMFNSLLDQIDKFVGIGGYKDQSISGNAREVKKVTFDAESFLATLTTKPGVYQMFDSSDTILYVGKANLRNRVKSYFRASGLQAKTMALVAKISRIENLNVTKSETEALLLEQSLIKKLRPPYNIILGDDKSYPYIYISDHKKFPQLFVSPRAKE